MVQVLVLVSVVELAVLFTLATVFVVLYHRRSGGRWRDTPVGRHLMRLTAALAVTFGLTLANAVAAVAWPAWPTLTLTLGGVSVSVLTLALVVQVAVFGALMVELANRLRLMLSGNGHTDRPGQ